LNTEVATTVGLVDPLWALVLQNAVFDSKGRIGMRKGYVDQTTTPMTNAGDVRVLHEYLRDNGTKTIIGFSHAAAPTRLVYESTDDGATWSDITGAISTTSNSWIFVDFNDRVYATAPGHKVWEYTGTGTFTQISGSPVTNGTLLAAYGRLWAGEDASTSIKYSVLLGGDDWTGTGSGSIDATNAFTNGNDTVMALAAFGSAFVVFGRKQILLYVDGTGSVLGIDPDNMYVVDTVEGTGCKFRDSVVSIGEGDLWFISDAGVQSFARVVQDKTNPLVDISKNVRGMVQEWIATEVSAGSEVNAIFSPEDQMVLIHFPTQEQILMIDTKVQMEDGTYRISEWTSTDMDADVDCIARRQNGDIIFGSTDGQIYKYTGYRDDGGDTDAVIELVYASPWMDFGEQAHNRLKIIKQFYGVFYGRETLTATARWSFDFRPLEFSETFTNDYVSSGGEFGAGEFGEDEYGTGHRLRKQYIAGMGEGQFVKVWITIQSTDVDDLVAIQEMGIYAKVGRFV
jgi:hypothetical protein